ncbi:unnamed protein product [Ectocarpus sp. 4 AP-2014]
MAVSLYSSIWVGGGMCDTLGPRPAAQPVLWFVSYIGPSYLSVGLSVAFDIRCPRDPHACCYNRRGCAGQPARARLASVPPTNA